MKVGIIRCQQTEDLCPATTCLACAAHGKGSFAQLGECQVVGVVSCGGCPGKRMPTNLRHGTTKLKFKPVLFKDGL